MSVSNKIPEGVEYVEVRRKGKVYRYWYWNPHRGTDRQGARIKLPDADKNPADFWREVERYGKSKAAAFPKFSIGALVEAFMSEDNPEWMKLSESTRENYAVHARRFKQSEWGPQPARNLKPVHAIKARDAMADTPVMANHMLAFGRTLWDWSIPRDYSDTNPFDAIKDIDVPDRGHVPWPLWVVQHVLKHAPDDLRRTVRLGIATSQRESDLIRMGSSFRERSGIWCRPKKTRKRRRKAVWIPLSIADAIEIDSWCGKAILFENARFKTPRPQLHPDLYIFGPRGKPTTEDSLRNRYVRWCDNTEAGKDLCRRWKAWLADQIHKYEWDIATDDLERPSLHGLRGTGILARYADGYDTDQIMNDIGMSRQMVDRYMRFKDQMVVADAGRARLQLVKG